MGSVLMPAPMLRVVPIVEGPEMVSVDLLRQEVQVFGRWPVRMEPRRHPTECRPKSSPGSKDDEEQHPP